MLALKKSGVLWFLDCDMEIISRDSVARLRHEFSDRRSKMIGTLILNKEGAPMWWNYGHEMDPLRDAEFGRLIEKIASERATAWEELRAQGMDYAWIREESMPQRRIVDWVAEGSFALRAQDSARIEGYDMNFRYHEGQDLAHRLRDAGVEVIFSPEVVVRHLEFDVRKEKRADEREISTKLFYEKHGKL